MVASRRRHTLFLLLFALASAFPLQAASPVAGRPAMPGTLDHKAIHEQYNEGDFESVIAALEKHIQRNRSCSLEDSVFIAKHLAVVYSANPATREKGRYFMHRLLELVPSAKLVDMYVSEEIDRIFEKVREEFLDRQSNFGVVTALPSKSTDQEAPSPAQPERKGNPGRGMAGFWIASGAAIVLAGTAAVYFIHQSETAPGAPQLPSI